MGESKVLEALFPGPRRFVLSALFGEPERWWTLPELAGRAGVQPSSLRQHVAHLRDGGIIREKRDEGRPMFQAATDSPVYADVRSLINKLTDATGGGETVLIVEDQEATAQITRILLESWGYRVLEAHDAGEAMRLFDQSNGDVQLLLTDVIMPGMNGPQLAGELQRRRPELRIVYMSGYPAEELNGNNAAFLPKPFNPASLSRMIRRELDRVGKSGA